MSWYRPAQARWLPVVVLLVLLIGQAGCARQPAPTATPVAATSASIPAEAALATPSDLAKTTPRPGTTGKAPVVTAVPELPAHAFRYELKMKLAAGADMPGPQGTSPTTTITGQYRDGAWQETAQTEGAQGQEAITIDRTTYSRSTDQGPWARWSGVGFDAAYGLASPFTVLRLYPLALRTTRGVLEPAPGSPEATFRTQAEIAAETVDSLLKAGIEASAPDTDTKLALTSQMAPMAASQTITYWAGQSGRIYRAVATLLTQDDAGKPAPWMEVTWRFWNYDDPSITISAPQSYVEGADATPEVQAETTGSPAGTASSPTNLIVRVFASQGKPAADVAVTVYPAGDEQQAIDARDQAESEFALPPGHYDVRVQTSYAEQWVRGVDLSGSGVVTRDVTFDFGTLELTVTRDGTVVPVDIVTYPAGNRNDWVDWRSDNPATIQLRAGTYDLEIAYGDYKSTQTVTGVVIKAGETQQRVVHLNR